MVRISKRHIGRPMDFTAFDGRVYNGRIVDVRRRSWLVFTYWIPGLGEIANIIDLREHRNRIEVY